MSNLAILFLFAPVKPKTIRCYDQSRFWTFGYTL